MAKDPLDWRLGPGVEAFYRERLHSLSPNTTKMYDVYLKGFIGLCCETFKTVPEELDFAHCVETKLKDRTMHLAISTEVIEHYILILPESERVNGRSCLKVYFDYLVRTKRIPRNPVSKCAPEVRRRPPKRSLPSEEIISLMRVIRQEAIWIRAVLSTQFAAGMRVSEVIALKAEDIRQVEQKLVVYIQRNVKNYRASALPLPDIHPLLNEYMAWLCSRDISTVNLFVKENGREWTISDINQILKRLGEVAHCSRTVTSHDLRRAYRQMMKEAMGSSDTTRQLMRHQNPATTEGYTGYPTTEEILRALSSVPSVQVAERLAKRWLKQWDL